MFMLCCRKPGPLLWRPRAITLTPSITRQLHASVTTYSCPASRTLFAVPHLGTCSVMSCGSSMPCDAAVHQTSAVASTGGIRPLFNQKNKSIVHRHQSQPQLQPRESQGESKSRQSCLSQLSPALGLQILVPGNVKTL